MAFAVAHGAGPSKNPERYHFFYDKKLAPGVKDMLTRERLSQDEFLTWWRTSPVLSDFWLESARKALFNPSTWKTRATINKEMLARTAVEVRVTDGACCTSGRWLETVVDRWQHDHINEPVFDFFWVGRTWIGKRQAPNISPGTPCGHGTGTMQATAHQPHEQDAAAGGSQSFGRDSAPQLGSDRDKSLHRGGQGGGKTARPLREDEADLAHDSGRAACESKRAQGGVRYVDYQGQSTPPDPRLAQHSRSRTHEDREA